MKAKITIPKSQILNGGPLYQVTSELDLVANLDKDQSNGDLMLFEDVQSAVEDVLTQENVLLIIAHGGKVENYLMYAKLPFHIGGVSIYEVEVPEGMESRAMRVTDGAEIIEGKVKKLGQWCGNNATQKFSADFAYTYLDTSAPGWWMSGDELKVFVEGFEAELLTVKEYKALEGTLI